MNSKLLSLTIGVFFVFGASAQTNPIKASKNIRLKSFKQDIHSDQDMSAKLVREPNPYTVAHTTTNDPNEAIIGETVYDYQTNAAIQNRIYRWSDGTIAATWTYGEANPNFADRGTGYNFFDGSNWGPQPTQRIESKRVGWPSMAGFPGGGELITTHTSNEEINVVQRATSGTGAWTETLRAGTNSLFPRTVVGGANGHTVHSISISTTSGLGGGVYHGQDGAILYSRSLDGGSTWDIDKQIFPELDSSNYYSFSIDAFAMAEPKGDTIAFVTGGFLNDVILMKSTDNGNTWTKTIIDDLPYNQFNEMHDMVLDTPSTNDGAVAVLLDNNGMAHVWWGEVAVLNDDTTDGSLTYFPAYYNDLMYWNESFGSNPAVSIAGALDLNGDSTLNFVGWGAYNTAVVSQPSAGIDANGTIYVSYAAVVEDLVNGAGDQNYRHIYMVKSDDGGQTWTAPNDVTPFDPTTENVYGSLYAKVDNYAHLVYQRDFEPGTAVSVDADPYDGNEIVYLAVPKELNVGINETPNIIHSVEVYPNPASQTLYLSLNLDKATKLTGSLINEMGQQVYSFETKAAKAQQNLQIDVSDYASGLYFLNVTADDQQISKKILINSNN